MAESTSNRIYSGVVFDPAKNNYVEWKDSLYASLRFLQLSRWAIPLKEGELGVKKKKPANGQDRIDAWEDAAEKALAVVSESLGSLRWMIKDCEEPDEALKIIHLRYSGATNRDSIKLETKWVNEKPKGDSFMEYISTMALLRDKLKAIGVERSDTELCLRMMKALGDYPDDHPLRDVYKQLKHKFRDAPEEVTLEYFTGYVQMAMEDLDEEDVERVSKSKKSDDMQALHAMTRLAERMEQVLAMTHYGGNTKTSTAAQSGNRTKYTGCHFCKSQLHQIANCDDPKVQSRQVEA
jgi:hypothetical protein